MGKLFLMIVLVLLTLSSNQVFAVTLISDNFDSYTPGSPPGNGWNTDNSGATIVVDNTVSNSPSNSVRIQRTSSGGSFSQSHSQITGQITYEAFLRSTTNQRETVVMYASGNGGSGPWVSIGAQSGYLASYDTSTGWHLIISVNSDQWYHVKIVANIPSNTFDVYVDDMNTPVQTGLRFRDYPNVTSLDSIHFAVFNAFNPPQTTDSAYVDDVLANSASVPIPTITEWGMIIFAILAGFGSLYYLRRMRRTES